MTTTSQLRIWVTALLLAWGGVASAQGPLAQGWGVGVDASRLLGGHAVVQVERAQSSEWLWQVAAGPYVGTVNGENPFWKGLKGDVVSGSVVSVGSLVFPTQDPKLGATWFLGLDLTRESCRLLRDTEDPHAAQAPGFGVVVQTREEARLLAGAQWAIGQHVALRAHVGMGVVRDRLSSRMMGEEVSAMPMARPGGLALLWRW